MKKDLAKQLQELLEKVQLKTVEELLDALSQGDCSPALLKAADDICKRHGIQLDPTDLNTGQPTTTLSSLPFAPSQEDSLQA